MDFNPLMLQTFRGDIPLPFYMTHPEYWNRDTDRDRMRDMEYFRQTYPRQVRVCQKRIADILDKMDYEGSMIYDEYPDKYELQRLAKTICDILNKPKSVETSEENHDSREGEDDFGRQREELVLVLLCEEICHRRQSRHKFW